ncbi:competence type IV pilus minor pilin ComGF [Pseudogracilibacillus auburnensis]|uniref:Competence protein ComGF n=1 Tax=Pseudogracilibacillus auburnensis TaxID=1494959 RepID=A0A2V3VGU3_9BACI|nr:ComGF family competence protein [Pseudogracilibacillus auburnensis]PXW80028.1 competence protein ComGF [Pseudogracilibacillus auburnensis]
MIELLLTLMIITMTLPFVALFFSYINTPSFEEDMSIQQFFIFLRNDALLADNVYSENNKLFFNLTTNEIAKIEYYPSLIRRQVNGKGHEIYVRDIASLTIESLPYGSKIIVQTVKGETYEKTIAHYD